MKQICKIFTASAVFSGALFLAGCGSVADAINDGGNSNGSLPATITIDGTDYSFSCNTSSNSNAMVYVECNSASSRRVRIEVEGTGQISLRLTDSLESNGSGGVIYSCNGDFIIGSAGICDDIYSINTRMVSATNVVLQWDRTISGAAEASSHTISFAPIDPSTVPSF